MPRLRSPRLSRVTITSLLIALMMVLSTAGGALAENEPDLPPPDPDYVPQAQEIVETSGETTRVEPVCKPKKGMVCPQDSVSNGIYTVYVWMSLAADDKGFHEYVKGYVSGSTNAAAWRVQSMLFGGALLRADNCGEIFTKGTNMESGDIVVSGETYGSRGWTSWYHGWNDCWNQTGHNNFKITTPSGFWDSYVNGDNMRKF